MESDDKFHLALSAPAQPMLPDCCKSSKFLSTIVDKIMNFLSSMMVTALPKKITIASLASLKPCNRAIAKKVPELAYRS